MNLESMISEVLPTMLWAWISVGFFILGLQQTIKSRRWWYNLAKKAASPNRGGTVDQVMDRLSPSNRLKRFKNFQKPVVSRPKQHLNGSQECLEGS